MTQELIASKQTSANGVTTETMTCSVLWLVDERLAEHLESVPSSLVTGRQTTHKTVASIQGRSCRNCYPHPIELRRK
eukprot:4439754-Amphidinium_carterae.1